MVITKVVIPAAGLGTRFLPVTKVVPKELLPIGALPAIHYIVQEAVDAGLCDVNIVISHEKEALKHYFSPSDPLLAAVIERKKLQKIFASLDHLLANASFSYTVQEKPAGLGHAILMARNFVGNDFFAVLLPDDIIASNDPAIGVLCAVAREKKATVIAVQQLPIEEVSSYGVIAIKKQHGQNLFELGGVVEKPSAAEAPSTYAIVGRYVLSPAIFEALDAIVPGAQGELQLTDAIAHLIARGEPVYAHCITGKRFDTGNPAGLLAANLHFSHTK